MRFISEEVLYLLLHYILVILQTKILHSKHTKFIKYDAFSVFLANCPVLASFNEQINF